MASEGKTDPSGRFVLGPDGRGKELRVCEEYLWRGTCRGASGIVPNSQCSEGVHCPPCPDFLGGVCPNAIFGRRTTSGHPFCIHAEGEYYYPCVRAPVSESHAFGLLGCSSARGPSSTDTKGGDVSVERPACFHHLVGKCAKAPKCTYLHLDGVCRAWAKMAASVGRALSGGDWKSCVCGGGGGAHPTLVPPTLILAERSSAKWIATAAEVDPVGFEREASRADSIQRRARRTERFRELEARRRKREEPSGPDPKRRAVDASLR